MALRQLAGILAICGVLSLSSGIPEPYPAVAPKPTPPTPLEKNSWALLVAGSNGFYNYRHQADVCHSYHVMLAEGIPKERIIVMMYDDIANNTDNPTPGIIINRPNGTDVYGGVRIDYREDDVNPTNFLNVLKGNKEAMKHIGSGRVIQSDKNTNIFVYFSDHGGTGILCFPNADLPADDLERALREMRNESRYGKLIMYIEACESGSVFDNILEEDTDVYVMTAAGRDESSYGIYCDDGTCLGDEFSVRWMEHMDSEPKGTFETFFHQFQHVRTATIKSHVNIYGDFSIGPDLLTPNNNHSSSSQKTSEFTSYVNSRDVPLHYFRHKLSISNDVMDQVAAQSHLDQLIKGRKKADDLFDELVEFVTPDAPQMRSIINHDRLLLSKGIFPCYKNLLRIFRRQCFGHEHEYFIQHFYKFANMCIAKLDTTELVRNMPSICAAYQSSMKVRVL